MKLLACEPQGLQTLVSLVNGIQDLQCPVGEDVSLALIGWANMQSTFC